VNKLGDRPRVETAFDQNKVENMVKALEQFWKNRGIAVEVRVRVNNLTEVPNGSRYAVLEFDVYKQ